MTIPAFTPEASLDLSGQTCRAQAWSRGHAKGAVQPASCIGQCFQECLAYHPPSKAGCMAMCRLLCKLGGYRISGK